MARSLEIVLPTNATGVDSSFESTAAAGFSGRVYGDLTLLSTAVTATVLPSSPEVVTLSGLPDVDGVRYDVTYVYDGVGYARSYPERGEGAYRPGIVIPDRTTGLATIGAELYQDGAPSAEALTVTELVSGGGDYALAGWGLTAGRYLLRVLAGLYELGYAWAVSALTTGDLPPETVARRLLVDYIRRGFLGETLDQKDFCPVAIPGVTFDESNAAHASPFTPEEVRETVGFAALYIWDVADADDGTTSGVDATGSMVSSELVRTRVRADFTVPRSKEMAARIELYSDRFRDLMRGLSISHDGPPTLKITQRADALPQQLADSDSSNFRRRSIVIDVERRYRRTHAGPQEVTL